jgi:hypothetical protein
MGDTMPLKSSEDLEVSASVVAPGADTASAAVKRYILRNIRFLWLVAGMMVFFGLHNYLQELIMSLPGFRIGVFLGYL